ncbi:uncharacterized protein G2W53_018135 [Senna tora]|uniref:Uncharacterized protein n=1 Tax=Senna tora TaxID=362788 RepID=A0A834WPL5_9FABA|nr:uncharacterized protein G2W53_018135 [Senna tora]
MMLRLRPGLETQLSSIGKNIQTGTRGHDPTRLGLLSSDMNSLGRDPGGREVATVKLDPIIFGPRSQPESWVLVPCQSQGLEALFLGFEYLRVLVPFQSRGLEVSFLGFEYARVLVPCQSQGVLLLCQSRGLEASFLGYKNSGVIVPCQSQELDFTGILKISCFPIKVGLHKYFDDFRLPSQSWTSQVGNTFENTHLGVSF